MQDRPTRSRSPYQNVSGSRFGDVPAFLLEKPLSPTLAEASVLVREVEASGARAMVNFILRSDARYGAVKRAVVAGDLGEVVSLSASRRGTDAGARLLRTWTGLLISTGIHDLDAMSWIADAPIDRVYAETVHRHDPDGGEDAVVATLRFASGAIGQLGTSWVLPSTQPAVLDARLEVVCGGGGATVDGVSNGLHIVDRSGYRLPDLVHWPTDEHGVGGALGRSIGAFIQALADSTPFPMSLREAWRAEAAVHSILRSAADHRPVSPPTLD